MGKVMFEVRARMTWMGRSCWSTCTLGCHATGERRGSTSLYTPRPPKNHGPADPQDFPFFSSHLRKLTVNIKETGATGAVEAVEGSV